MTMSVFRGATVFLAGAMTAAVLAHAAQQAPKSAKPVSETAVSSTSATAAANHESADSKAKLTQVAAATSSTKKPADPAAVLLRDAANAGFRPEHIRGSLMFCRTATEIGSRFPVKTCYDEAQVRIKIDEYKTEQSQMQQQRTLPQFCNTTYTPRC